MPSKSPIKILIAAGGTGGHLFPAQALAKDFIEKLKNVPVAFAGSGLSTNPYFKKEVFPYFDIKSGTLFRGKLKGKVFSILSLIKGIKEAFDLLKREKPSLIIGFGSFHSFPILLAAVFKRIPIVLFESNAIAGKVNRVLSGWARFTAIQLKSASKRLSGKCVEVSSPLWHRENISSREEALKAHGLSEGYQTFLIFGGSQGAFSLNHVVKNSLASLEKKGKRFQVIHLTGNKDSFEEIKNFYEEKQILASVKTFEENMLSAWLAADLAICRAGAATLSEILAFEVPAILVPYPYAADDHQKYNAYYLQNEIKGGYCLLEENFTEENFTKLLFSISSEQLLSFKKAIQSFKEVARKPALYDLIIEHFALEGLRK